MNEDLTSSKKSQKPIWLKMRTSYLNNYDALLHKVEREKLHTVCQEAKCPNLDECWGDGTATFLLLGDSCTRGCQFCAVTRDQSPPSPDLSEPRRVASAVKKMGLNYLVLTSVTRDDLCDGGASVFAATLKELASLDSSLVCEVLLPDFGKNELDIVLDAAPNVMGHNIEVVERLTPRLRHPRFGYRKSIDVLERASKSKWQGIVKSSLMLGLGEQDEEIRQTMKDLRSAGVEILVLGQYLQPSPQHFPVAKYLLPNQFDFWAEEGRRLGFGHVAAGPLVRTSYKAAYAYAMQRGIGG